MVLLKDLKADELRRQLEDAELETDGKKSELVKRMRAHLEQQGYNPDTYHFENEMEKLLVANSSKLEEKIENKLENMQVENKNEMVKLLVENKNEMEKLLVENKNEVEKLRVENDNKMKMLIENSSRFEEKMENKLENLLIENSRRFEENENKMQELLENSSRMEETLRTEVLQMKNDLENRVGMIEHAEQQIQDGFVNIKQELEIQAAKVMTLEKKLESKLETTTQIPVMNRDIVKPPEYDGKSPWTNYHLQFEAAAMKNQWNDQDKAIHLILALRGDAANVLQAVPTEDMNDYEKLVKCLETRFGMQHLQVVYHCQLQARKQKCGESLQEYQLDIVRLTRLAYPGTPKNILECLAVQAFVDGLYDSEIKRAVLLSRSKTISAALSCALEYEAVKMSIGGWDKTRDVDVSTEERSVLGSIRKLLEEHMPKEKPMTNKLVKCWKRGKSTHVQSYCSDNADRSKSPKIVDPLPSWMCDENGDHCNRVEVKNGMVLRTTIQNDEWTNENLGDCQREDPILGKFVGWKSQNEKPAWEIISKESPEVKTLYWQWDSLVLEDGVLKRIFKSCNGEIERRQILVPKARVLEVLEEVHKGVSERHLGVHKTLEKLRERFY